MCSGCSGNYSGDYENWDPDLPGNAADYGEAPGLAGDGTRGFAGETGGNRMDCAPGPKTYSHLGRTESGDTLPHKIPGEREHDVSGVVDKLAWRSRGESALGRSGQEPASDAGYEARGGPDFEVMVGPDRITEIRVTRSNHLTGLDLASGAELRSLAFVLAHVQHSTGESAKYYQTKSAGEDSVDEIRRTGAMSCIAMALTALVAAAIAVLLMRG